MNTPLIRLAQKSDAAQFIEFRKITSQESPYLNSLPNEINQSIEEQENFIEQTNGNPNSRFYICEIDKKIVGSIDFHSSNKSKISHHGEIGMAVLKSYWRQGIGNKLINKAISWLINNTEILKINLLVREDNFAAIKLYEKNGFLEEGRIKKYHRENGKFFDMIFMGCEIRK